MRTHIRMHIDKKSGDVNEENYISCILDDDSTEIQPANSISKAISPNDITKACSLKTPQKTCGSEKQDIKVMTPPISST